MLSSEEMNVVNINPWRYQSQGLDEPFQAPRSQPSMDGDIDREYYNEVVNPRNSIIIDYIHYFVLTQGFYPKIGQQLSEEGPLSAEAWTAAGNEGEVPDWYSTVTITDAYAYSALYPQNVSIISDPAIAEATESNPDSLYLTKTDKDTARQIVFNSNVEDQPATTNTTRLSQAPEGQRNLGKGEDWLAFQRKKMADIRCRLELLEENEENEDTITSMRSRISDIESMIAEYERNKITDAAKRLSSVRGRLNPEYVRVLHNLYIQPTDDQLEDESGPPPAELSQVLGSEIYDDVSGEGLSTVSQRINLEMDLVDWWRNLEPSGVENAVYYNPIDTDPTSDRLFGAGHYYYVHNTGVSDIRSFDRGLRDQPAIEANFQTALRSGIEKILQTIGKKTDQNISSVLAASSLETRKDSRPGTPWLYAVKIPISSLENLPLASSIGKSSIVSAYKAAVRQKRLSDAARHKVSYKISSLEERMTITSNAIARYNTKIILSGAVVKGVNFRRESIRIRTTPALVGRLLTLNGLSAAERDFDSFEIILDQEYQPLGFFYNGSLYTKGVGIGDYFYLTDEEFDNILRETPEPDPCDISTSTAVTSRGVYNVFTGFSAASFGFILYGKEIYELAASQRNTMPWTEFVNSYVVPPPKIIPASIDNINFENLQDFLNALDENPQKTPEEIFELNNNLTFGPPNFGTSPAAILANSAKLSLNGIGDSLLECEQIPVYAQQIAGYIVGTIRQNPTAFYQIPPEKLLAFAFRIALNEVHKRIQEWITDQIREQREVCPEAMENFTPSTAAKLQELTQAAISSGGVIRPQALLNLSTRIVEEQLQCLIGGVGANILLAIQNQPSGPWKQGLLNGYSITRSALPRITLKKISSPGDFLKVFAKKIIDLLVAALVQWIIVEIASTVQRAIGCKDPVNTDRFEDALTDENLGDLYAAFYGEADLNFILESSGINDYVAIIKDHIKNEDESLPTQEQAREFHDDISKMTTARELTGLLKGIYSPEDRLILEIHGMVYTKHNGSLTGQSLEKNDTIYSTLNINPTNIVAYLQALGQNIPEAEIQKAFQPHRPVVDSECVPAGQESYERLRVAGFTAEEITEQINENMCSALQSLDRFCERNNPDSLQQSYDNFIRETIIENTPSVIRKFLEELLALKDEGRKIASRIVTNQVDFDPPGLIDITNELDADGQIGNPETRNFKQFGLDYQVENDRFVIGSLSLEVSEAGSVTIKNTETNKVLVSLTEDNNARFKNILRPAGRAEQGQKQLYKVPTEILALLPKNSPPLRTIAKDTDQARIYMAPGLKLRAQYFQHQTGDAGPTFNNVSNTASISDFITAYYRSEVGRQRKEIVQEKILEALMVPNQEDPCFGSDIRARGETALEAIRVRIVNYLLNIAPLFNRYALGSPMSKVIVSDYLFNEMIKEFEQKGMLRNILASCTDISKVFREFDDIKNMPSEMNQLKAIVYRLYSETLRKLSVTTPLGMTNTLQQSTLSSLRRETDDNGDEILSTSQFDRYSSYVPAVRNPVDSSLLFSILIHLGSFYTLRQELDESGFAVPHGYSSGRDKFFEQANSVLQYFLPIDAIIALQTIFLDRFYNHLDLVPEFEFYKDQRIKLADDAFKSAYDPQYFPVLSPRFSQFPRIIGNTEYFRRSDILEAIKYNIIMASKLLSRHQTTFGLVNRPATVRIEEREMAWFRSELQDGVMANNVLEGYATGYYEDILAAGNPYYEEEVAQRARDKAFPYTGHAEKFVGDTDKFRYTATLLALGDRRASRLDGIEGRPGLAAFEPGELLEGAELPSIQGNIETLWNKVLANRYGDAGVRDSFGFVLLKYVTAFVRPGTEAQRSVQHYYDYYRLTNDHERKDKVWSFYREATRGARRPEPMWSYWQGIMDRTATRGDAKADESIRLMNTIEGNFTTLSARLERVRNAVVAANILEQGFSADVEILERPSVRTELQTYTATRHTATLTNMGNQPKYPVLRFDQNSGRRRQYLKKSTRYRLRSFNQDMQEVFSLIEDSLSSVEELVDAYIATEE